MENRLITFRTMLGDFANALFERTNDAVFMISLDQKHLLVNQRASDMLGYEIDELINMPINKIIEPPERLDSQKIFDKLIKGESIPIYERNFVKKDGTKIPVEINVSMIYDSQEQPLYVQSIVRNISKRKLAERNLKKQAKAFRLVLNTLPDPVFLWQIRKDSGIVLSQVNNAVLRLYGSSSEFYLGLKLKQIANGASEANLRLYGLNWQDIASIIEQVMETGEGYHSEKVAKDEERWFEIDCRKASEDTVLLITRDVTERKSAINFLRQARDELEMQVKLRTDALLESEQLYRELMDQLNQGVCFEDENGHLVFANPQMTRLFGYSKEEMLNFHWTDLAPEEEREKILLETSKRPKGISSSYEAELLTKTGIRTPVIISSKPLFTPGGEYRGTISVFTDLSEYKKSQEELMQLDKLASLGRLAAGVAHELNNPLAYIYSNFETLEDYLKVLSIINKYLGRIEAALQENNFPAVQNALNSLKEEEEMTPLLASSEVSPFQIADIVINEMMEMQSENLLGIERMVKIVQDLREFSRDRDFASPKEEFQISEVIQNSINMLKYEFKNYISVKLDLDDLPPVFGHSDRLNQVFLNLLSNAADAIDKKVGRIEIEGTTENNDVIISITDNGCGISEENLKKVFDPFFTTKPPGKGTGLGLAITHEIIHSHGGRLGISSTQGVGTTVKMVLPSIAKTASEI